MEQILAFLKGKKTYIVAICVGIVAALKQLGIEIPAWVVPLLGAVGLGTLRDALNHVKEDK
jgi:hypothetical protein